LANWIAEFKRWCPSLKVLRFHTNDITEQANLIALMRDPKKSEVVVTTYDTLTKSGTKYSFQHMVWRSLILDEGHKVKNNESQVEDLLILNINVNKLTSK
jgi:SNF2 family DNA or RNA helicase